MGEMQPVRLVTGSGADVVALRGVKMKACKEARRLLAKKRRRYAGKNGVIPGALMDDIWLDRLLSAKRRNARRRKDDRGPG